MILNKLNDSEFELLNSNTNLIINMDKLTVTFGNKCSMFYKSEHLSFDGSVKETIASGDLRGFLVNSTTRKINPKCFTTSVSEGTSYLVIATFLWKLGCSYSDESLYVKVLDAKTGEELATLN